MKWYVKTNGAPWLPVILLSKTICARLPQIHEGLLRGTKTRVSQHEHEDQPLIDSIWTSRTLDVLFNKSSPQIIITLHKVIRQSITGKTSPIHVSVYVGKRTPTEDWHSNRNTRCKLQPQNICQTITFLIKRTSIKVRVSAGLFHCTISSAGVHAGISMVCSPAQNKEKPLGTIRVYFIEKVNNEQSTVEIIQGRCWPPKKSVLFIFSEVVEEQNCLYKGWRAPHTLFSSASIIYSTVVVSSVNCLIDCIYY